ncbi:MAG: DUF262 domain-containing protein [Nitrospira sp.]
MDIKPVEQTIRTLLKSFFYRIPRFQRPYSWDSENVTDFWNDTVASEEPDYFIGSFVVYPEHQKSDTMLIVDGQQRLTTITLLFAAVRDALAQLGHEDFAKGVQKHIENEDANNKTRFVLDSESPYPYLQEYIQKFGAPELEPKKGAEEDALKSAYDFLKAQIGTMLASVDSDPMITEANKPKAKKQKLLNVRDKLLRLQLILITLTNEDDAYLIFETLNTRGKDLGLADLVKNHITRTLKQGKKPVDATKDKWDDIRSHLDESSSDIDVNRFLHHSWLSRHPYLPEKRMFKELKRTVTKAEAPKYLNELHADSRLYRNIMEPTSRQWTKPERPLKESLQALALFRVVQPVPMLLAILRAYGTAKTTLNQTKQVMRAMEHFHFQFSAVTAQRTGGGTALMFALSARELDAAITKDNADKVLKAFVRKLRERLPTEAEFAAAFAEFQLTDDNSRQRPLIRYLLSKLDSYLRKHGTPDYDTMSIEHIGSQRPKAPEIVLSNVGKIGNLILVPETLNSDALANKPFKKKKQLLKAEHVPMDHVLAKATKWNELKVQERTAALASLIQTKVFSV